MRHMTDDDETQLVDGDPLWPMRKPSLVARVVPTAPPKIVTDNAPVDATLLRVAELSAEGALKLKLTAPLTPSLCNVTAAVDFNPDPDTVRPTTEDDDTHEVVAPLLPESRNHAL